MNVLCATGNLGNDAEVRYLPNGDPVTNFSLAVKSGYGKNESTTWLRCSVFGKRGDAISEYLTKGAQIGISGEISLREYETKDGKKQSLECRVNEVTLLGRRESSVSTPEQKQGNSDKPKPQGAFADMEDDIPF